jgi:hypothetical protein
VIDSVTNINLILAVNKLPGNKILVSCTKSYDHPVKFQIFFFHKMAETIVFHAYLFTHQVTFVKGDNSSIESIMKDIESTSSGKKKSKPANNRKTKQKSKKEKNNNSTTTTNNLTETVHTTTDLTEQTDRTLSSDIIPPKQTVVPQQQKVTAKQPEIVRETKPTSTTKVVTKKSDPVKTDVSDSQRIQLLEQQVQFLLGENAGLKQLISQHAEKIQQLTEACSKFAL